MKPGTYLGPIHVVRTAREGTIIDARLPDGQFVQTSHLNLATVDAPPVVEEVSDTDKPLTRKTRKQAAAEETPTEETADEQTATEDEVIEEVAE